MDNLARNAMLARQAGMTYGKWKALHYNPDENVPPKEKEVVIPEGWMVCERCGKPFKPTHRQRFCDFYCRTEAYKEQTMNMKQKGKQKGKAKK